MHPSKDLPKHFIGSQRLTLSKFESKGYVLDIGGGGEGIIGRMMGDKVVAVDNNPEELAEAPDNALKIIMDVRDLKFLDESFEAVTAFFSFMYIKQEDHNKVMTEIYRVLKPGGDFLLWDVNIPKYSEGMKDIYVMPIEIELQNDLVKTSYGTPWKGREQDKSYFVKMAEDIGFKPEDKDEQDEVYYIKFKK